MNGKSERRRRRVHEGHEGTRRTTLDGAGSFTRLATSQELQASFQRAAPDPSKGPRRDGTIPHAWGRGACRAPDGGATGRRRVRRMHAHPRATHRSIDLWHSKNLRTSTEGSSVQHGKTQERSEPLNESRDPTLSRPPQAVRLRYCCPMLRDARSARALWLARARHFRN